MGDLQPIKPMDLVARIEALLIQTIGSCYPHEWDEDFITLGILRTLRNDLKEITIRLGDGRAKVMWRPFKLAGKAERCFGDIALLVQIHDKDGQRLEGAAFLEAKRRYPESAAYDSIRHYQLDMICEHAPHAMALLYDFNQITEFVRYQTLPDHRLVLKNPIIVERTQDSIKVAHPRQGGFEIEEFTSPATVSSTLALTVPLTIVAAVGRKDVVLYRYGMPFSAQLVLRYLNGFDLEFSREALRTAKGWFHALPPPKFLLIVQIHRGGESDLENPSSFEFDVNQERFEPLTD